MKTLAFSYSVKCAALVMAFGWGVSAHAEVQTNSEVRIAPPALIKSVFVSDAKVGKDPFFPTSTRRLDAIAIEVATQTNSAPQQSSLTSLQLALKGISGTKIQPLALINSSTVGIGELAEIRCGRQIIRIRCREIRERSVLIELEGGGETRELRLREGI